jgi:predicted acetyltransferase
VSLDVRNITEDEVRAWVGSVAAGFLQPGGEADAEVARPTMDLARTWAGFDGDRVVSTFRSFPSELTLPGGARLSSSAITAVTTSVTHRRRGLASRMMAADLAASKERGEATASLIAAEHPIYGRFGFGVAAENESISIDSRTAKLALRPGGSTELVNPEEGRRLVTEIHERQRGRAGALSLPGNYWDRDFGFLVSPSWGEGKKFFTVIARDPSGVPIGLARYEVGDEWKHNQPRNPVTVQRFLSGSTEATALLWGHLLDLDWAGTVSFPDGPSVSELPLFFTDARDVHRSDRTDFLWMRPLDLVATLEARRYWASGSLVVEVTDPMGLSNGTVALDAGPDGATVTNTTREPDVTLSLGSLSTLLMGVHRAQTLWQTGRIDEHTVGGVATADLLFQSPEIPWCPTIF